VIELNLDFQRGLQLLKMARESGFGGRRRFFARERRRNFSGRESRYDDGNGPWGRAGLLDSPGFGMLSQEVVFLSVGLRENREGWL